MKVLLRCDYGPQKGLGHLKRSSVLIEALVEAGDQVFIVDYRSDLKLAELLELQDIPFKAVRLVDIEATVTFVGQNAIDLVILDSYELDLSYETRLYADTRALIFVLDDLFKPHQCDFLLNHNLHARAEQYGDLVPTSTQVFCGPAYSLVGTKLQATKVQAVTVKYDYFLSLGATDHQNLLPRLVASLPRGRMAIATTSLNPNLANLQACCAEYEKVDLYIDHLNLGLLFKQARLAVVSASALMMEAIYLGRVFLAINTTNNQSRNTRFLKAAGFPIITHQNLVKVPGMVREIEVNHAHYRAKVNAIAYQMGQEINTLKHELRNHLAAARADAKAT